MLFKYWWRAHGRSLRAGHGDWYAYPPYVNLVELRISHINGGDKHIRGVVGSQYYSGRL